MFDLIISLIEALTGYFLGKEKANNRSIVFLSAIPSVLFFIGMVIFEWIDSDDFTVATILMPLAWSSVLFLIMLVVCFIYKITRNDSD